MQSMLQLSPGSVKRFARLFSNARRQFSKQGTSILLRAMLEEASDVVGREPSTCNLPMLLRLCSQPIFDSSDIESFKTDTLPS